MNRYSKGSGQIWLDDVACVGSETSLVHCRHNGWGQHNCFHSEDVGILCKGKTVQYAQSMSCHDSKFHINSFKTFF